MQFHFSPKGPCCLTRHNGLLAVETLRWILIRVAFSTQQELVLGSKRFLHQRATAFGALEAPLMPVTAFVGQILGESKSMLMCFYLSAPPRNKVKNGERCSGDSKRWHVHLAGGMLRGNISTQHHGVGIFCRSLAETTRECFGTGNSPSLCNIRDMFLLEELFYILQLAFKGKQVINILMCAGHLTRSAFSTGFGMNFMYFLTLLLFLPADTT